MKKAKSMRCMLLKGFGKRAHPG